MQLIPQRFFIVPRKYVHEVVPCYQKLKEELKNRPLNTVYNKYNANLQEGFSEYLNELGDDRNNEKNFNWKPKYGAIKLKISNVGPLNYTGHWLLPDILNIAEDPAKDRDNVMNEMDCMFPKDQLPVDNRIHTRHCSSTFMSDTTAIASIHKAYKGVVPCRTFLLHSEKLRYRALKHDEAGINQLFSKLEINKVKQKQFKRNPNLSSNHRIRKLQANRHKQRDNSVIKDRSKQKLKVIDSTILPYLKRHHPGLLSSLDNFKILSEAIQYTIAMFVPQTFHHMMQFMLKSKDMVRKQNTSRGQWLQNIDLIINRVGGKVFVHKDHEDLIINSACPPPAYIVYKLARNSEPQMLCNMSLKSSGCNFDRSTEKGDKEHGGHLCIYCGAAYGMFGVGSCYGITHSLHNCIEGKEHFDANRFGTFNTCHYSIVARPNR